MDGLPTGTVTFLFTDLEGQTPLWEQRPELMRVALARHDALLRQAVGAQGGQVVKTTGDGVHAAFARAPDALAAALAAQRALMAEAWELPRPLRARMGLHSGAAEERDGDYYGPAVNRAARVMQAGHGGQVLLSEVTAGLVRGSLPAGAGVRDLGEHRLKDLLEPEHLFQLVAPDLPERFPPLRTLGARQHNLPLQLTSFVGRERELAEVQALVRRHRLVTLTGAGGCGKTRLAFHVAADLLEAHADGAWFVDLAPVADEALIARVALSELGAREVPGQTASETLVDYLRVRSLLLVLDNCEHVVVACAALTDALLRACPGVRVVATSREPLGVVGEATWRVPSLGLPPLEAGDAVILRSEAVRLFVERARLVQPSFAVTTTNVAALAQLCRRLDGIPLALELAAARVRGLTVEQIVGRLHDRFRLLTGGSRTALRRQQTLRALVDWSYDLLSEDERALLRCLSVFVGGWTLEAAEAVSAALPDALGLLLQLVDKSLVVAESDGTEARYRLLETIRQYAQEKLHDAAEAAAARDRHRDYYLSWAERAAPEVVARDQLIWYARIEAEHDNLRLAIEWSAADGTDRELRLCAALAHFWVQRGYFGEGSDRLAGARASA